MRSILADTATTYRREWPLLLVLATLIEVPLVLAEMALHVTPSLRSVVQAESLAGLAALLTLYASLSHHFLAGVLERVVGAERHGHIRPTVGEVIGDLPWHRLVIADVLLTAMILVGLGAFVLPGLLVATWFSLALPIINLEDRQVLDAFRRSRLLVRGHSWRVGTIAVGAFAVPQLIVGTVLMIVDTNNGTLDAFLHALVATIVLPFAALPIVIAAFDLVALDLDTQ